MIIDDINQLHPKFREKVLAAEKKQYAAKSFPVEIEDEVKATRKFNKYGVAAKEDRTIGNMVFDSKREMERWEYLRTLELAGEIKDLKTQVQYVLVPSGVHKKSQISYKGVSYFADFVYIDKAGNTIVEDVKAMRTAEYIIKKKLLLSQYPDIIFVEKNVLRKRKGGS